MEKQKKRTRGRLKIETSVVNQGSITTFIINLVSVILFLSVAPIRFILHEYNNGNQNSIIFIILTLILFLWIFQVKNRILDPEKRKYLIWLAAMLLLLNVIRTIKYSLSDNYVVVIRYAWYLYYVPITYTVLFAFFSVYNIGRPFAMKHNPKYDILYIPPTLISLGILTNDLHMQAFRFEGTFFEWNDQACVHGPLFWVAVIWIIGMSLITISVAFYRCMIDNKRKNIWMPFIPVLMGNIYLLVLLIFKFKRQPYTMPEMVIFMFPALMESLILAGFLPSNTNYGKLWKISHVVVGVMDRKGNIHQNIKSDIHVEKAQIEQAKNKPIRLPDTEFEIKSYEIPSGTGYWVRDISKVIKLKQQLEDLGDVLAEENAVLKAENDLEENRVRVKKINELYNSLSKELKPQIDKASALVQKIKSLEVPFDPGIRYGCILTVFIKRYSNLLFNMKDGQISANELKLCIDDTLEYLKLYGVKVHSEYLAKGNIEEKVALLSYSVLEEAIEQMLPDMNAIMINFRKNNDFPELNISADNTSSLPDFDRYKETLNKVKGKICVETEDETTYIKLTFGEVTI